MKHKLMLAALPALALAACGGGATDANTVAIDNAAVPAGETIVADNTANDTAMTDPAAPMTGQQFADTAAASDMFEIESAKLARDKATAAPVKEFAAMMIKDHTASTAKLKDAAAKAEPAITPSPAMNAEQTANLEALRAASGAAFDTLYKQQQVAAHQKALAALQGYAASGDVPSLKAFAGETAKVVEAHFRHVSAM
jgi:putative membrane protein